LKECAELARRIAQTLNEELPIATKEGGMIRKGAVKELDELITLTQDSQALLLELEEREKQATGITSLKVRYNNVFGFYIELTKTHSHKAPDHYRRKQTLTNAERYTTDELDRLEEKVLSARTKRDQLEYEIFSSLRAEVVANTPVLLGLARSWTRWDVLSSFAWLSAERGYTCPTFGENVHLELCQHRQTHSRRVPAADRPEHGGEKHAYAPGGAERDFGASRIVRSCRQSRASAVPRNFHPHRRERRAQ
jgi:DNA mismatch repair protein MutS